MTMRVPGDRVSGFRHLPQVAVDMLSGPMGFYSDSGSYPISVLGMAPDEEQVFYCPLIENPFALNHVFCALCDRTVICLFGCAALALSS